MMRVGFLGVQCDNPNLGVSALAYAGVWLMHGLTHEDVEFVLFSDNSVQGIARMVDQLGLGSRSIRAVAFRHRNPRKLVHSAREIASCDVIVDFTGGDSFSDIYGWRRLAKLLLHKELAILTRTPLVLAPQTYGPFGARGLLPVVQHVLRRARLRFARDAPSSACVRELTGLGVHLATDVALALPWNPPSEARCERSTIGLNVSGLLWGGGYTGANQFGLRADYPLFCRSLIRRLLDLGYHVQLVPHVVVVDKGSDEGEDAAARSLKAEFPDVELAPQFRSPVEAKSFIAGTDVFIGARMHATIAAFSAGVPTIPVAYSRKFEGLYASIGYDAVVDLTALETGEAVELVLQRVADADVLQSGLERGRELAGERLRVFTEAMGVLVAELRLQIREGKETARNPGADRAFQGAGDDKA